MKTSVALCTYNGAQFVIEQIRSILDQTLPPDEVIVCDDASTDGTLPLLETIRSAATVPIRIHRNSSNVGLTKNFERAIKRCTGDIIFLADQDDVWRRDKIERMLAVFQCNPAVSLVFSDGELVDESLRPTGHRLWESIRFGQLYRRMVSRGDAFAALLRRNAVTGAATAFRRKDLDVALPFPSQWVHDGWIALMFAAQSNIALIDEPLIKYRLHHSQQIGAELGLLGQMRGSRQRTAELWQSQTENYSVVRERLAQLDPVRFQQHIRLLGEKIEHSKIRSEILARQSWSWPMDILRETVNFRYFLYSSGGWKSIMKDILMPLAQW